MITSVGFIGTGVMGASMARHLLNAGLDLHIYSRTRAKAAYLEQAGAQWHDSPTSLAAGCQAIITMVGYPNDVEAIYLADDGLIHTAAEGCLLIDMTTSCPVLAAEIAAQAQQQGNDCLDAPVSGGDIGAREARLSIMVGGPEHAFQRALPLLSLMGKQIVRQGPAGSGQHTKMANQIAIAAGMVGVCESLAYAQQAGLDPTTVLDSISGGAAGSWSLSNLAPRMIAGDNQPGFFIKHFIKDMSIALAAASRMNLQLPGLALAKQCYDILQDSGHGDDGTQALYNLYVQQALG